MGSEREELAKRLEIYCWLDEKDDGVMYVDDALAAICDPANRDVVLRAMGGRPGVFPRKDMGDEYHFPTLPEEER